mgnify:CR=1 FL=1
MKKWFKLFAFLFIGGLALIVVLKVTNRYIVLDFSKKLKPEPYNFTSGDTIQPLSKYNFSNGRWKSYVIMSSNDIINIPSSLKSARCLVTEDTFILKEMQKKWRFIFAGGDMATIESKLYLYKDRELVFKCGIVLDTANQGLQSSEFGWVKAENEEILNSVERL